MAHPHTRYITHAQRRKARRESLLAWQCHRLHSILRGKPSGPPRYSSSSTNPQSDSQYRPGADAVRQAIQQARPISEFEDIIEQHGASDG